MLSENRNLAQKLKLWLKTDMLPKNPNFGHQENFLTSTELYFPSCKM